MLDSGVVPSDPGVPAAPGIPFAPSTPSAPFILTQLSGLSGSVPGFNIYTVPVSVFTNIVAYEGILIPGSPGFPFPPMIPSAPLFPSLPLSGTQFFGSAGSVFGVSTNTVPVSVLTQMVVFEGMVTPASPGSPFPPIIPLFPLFPSLPLIGTQLFLSSGSVPGFKMYTTPESVFTNIVAYEGILIPGSPGSPFPPTIPSLPLLPSLPLIGTQFFGSFESVPGVKINTVPVSVLIQMVVFEGILTPGSPGSPLPPTIPLFPSVPLIGTQLSWFFGSLTYTIPVV